MMTVMLMIQHLSYNDKNCVQWCWWRFQWLWWLTSTIHKIYDTCPEKMRTCLNKNFFFRQICISDSYKDDFVISKEWKTMRKVKENRYFHIFIWKHSSFHGISYMRYPSFIECSSSCKLNIRVYSYPQSFSAFSFSVANLTYHLSTI